MVTPAQADNVYLQCFDVAELKRIKNERKTQNGDGSQSGSTYCVYRLNETQQKTAGSSLANYNYD